MRYIIHFIAIFLIIVSCKSRQVNINEKQSHFLLKKALIEIYKNPLRSKSKNFEIYTRDLDKTKLEDYIRSIKLYTHPESNFGISIDTTWFDDFYDLDRLIIKSQFDAWNPDLLNIENLNTQFELKNTENIEYLNSKIRNEKLGVKKQYEERVITWYRETGVINIVSATPPVASYNGKKVLLFTSIYNSGLTAWLFEKQNDEWVIFSNVDIAIY